MQGRDPRTGKFLKGNPGGGRPVGSLGKSASARARILASSESIVKKMIEKAEAGDNQMIQMAMQIIAPPFRAELAPVQILGAAEAIADGRFDDAVSLISQASLDGRVGPDSAKQLTEQLKAAEEAKRISSLQDQLAVLREKIIDCGEIEHRPIRMIGNG